MMYLIAIENHFYCNTYFEIDWLMKDVHIITSF